MIVISHKFKIKDFLNLSSPFNLIFNFERSTVPFNPIELENLHGIIRRLPAIADILHAFLLLLLLRLGLPP